MRITWDTPVSELYHSDDNCRITPDTLVSELYHSDDELMHWKYIKREKKNGRWVYYYDESAADRDDRDSEQRYHDSEKKTWQAERDLKSAKERLAETGASVDSKIFYGNQISARDNYKRAVKSLKRANSFQNREYRKYQSRTISNFAAKVISKGAVKVANFFSGLFSKKKKG
jgi:hypothetical protein